MKIHLELELEVDVVEKQDRVIIDAIRFPGCEQNLMPFMSVTELDQAQQAVEDEVEKETAIKLHKIRERKEMRGDHLREMARDIQQQTLRELESQRGVR